MANTKIRVVWWNVQNFGAPFVENPGKPGECTKEYDPRRISTIAKLMTDIKPDVLVIQEVVGSSQSTLPFTIMNKLHDALKSTTLTQMLYPEFLGNDDQKGHSMLVFFNPKKLTPTYSVDYNNKLVREKDLNRYVKATSGNKLMGSEKISGNKGGKKGNSVFKARSPILSPFKTVSTDKIVNVYSIHAKNPVGMTDGHTVRLGEINALIDYANTEEESINVIGGDFNGAAPSTLPDNWEKGISKKIKSWTGETFSNSIRETSWSLAGKYPAYGYLKNSALDQVLWYNNDQIGEAYPWMVNPITGSLPNVGSLASKVNAANGYVRAVTATDANTQTSINNSIRSQGLTSWLGETLSELVELAKTKPAISQSKFTQINDVNNMRYVSDHFPVAIDLKL